MLRIVDRYYADRESADTGDERRTVWRMYCRAMLDTLEGRTLGDTPLKWRALANDGDKDLPVRFKLFWNRLGDDQLAELWQALERARHQGQDA